jgi:hypothetical protein
MKNFLKKIFIMVLICIFSIAVYQPALSDPDPGVPISIPEKKPPRKCQASPNCQQFLTWLNFLL